MITTEAWVLYEGSLRDRRPGTLQREEFTLPEPTDEEILAEPIYGCWEANMTHALERQPVDVCRLRREKRVVLGNAGVVRVLRAGRRVKLVREGDFCIVTPVGALDRYGYLLRIFAYDAPQTVGMLARQTVLTEQQLYPLPEKGRLRLEQWAAFSVRYFTAWDNWQVARGCFRLQVAEEEYPSPHAWGWGGGVALAELALARAEGFRTTMLASSDARLRQITEMGITPVDRRSFPGLDFDEERYANDREYRARYLREEKQFLALVEQITGGERVSIFIDNIGRPVHRATLRALARQGVITTAGWSRGDRMTFSRIGECIDRHIHVHTHGCRYSVGRGALQFAEEHGWAPPIDSTVHAWERVPELAEDFAAGRIHSYFPVFAVNPP